MIRFRFDLSQIRQGQDLPAHFESESYDNLQVFGSLYRKQKQKGVFTLNEHKTPKYAAGRTLLQVFKPCGCRLTMKIDSLKSLRRNTGGKRTSWLYKQGALHSHLTAQGSMFILRQFSCIVGHRWHSPMQRARGAHRPGGEHCVHWVLSMHTTGSCVSLRTLHV